MSEPVILAIIVIIPTLLATLVPVWMRVIDARERRRDRIEDMERQDAVAHSAKKQAQNVSDTIMDTSAAATVDRIAMKGQLNQIHTLVNSNLMAQMQLTLTATKGTLAVLKRLNLTDEVMAEIDTIERDILSQEKAVSERLAATKIANAETIQ